MASLDYPFRWTDGEPASAEGADAVNASINHILATDQGERVGRPNFGVDSVNLVFRNVASLAAADVRRQYTLAIQRYEKRADVLQVSVDTFETNESIGLRPKIIWRYRGKDFETIKKITPDNV